MIRALLAAVLCLLSAAPAPGLPGLLGGVREPLIVAYHPGAAEQVKARLGSAVIDEHGRGGWLLVGGVPAGAILSIPGVRYVEPDRAAVIDGAPPQDARWDEQWGPQKIGAPGAWDTTLGSPDLVVGIVDSGAELTHPDLSERLWRNPGEVLNGIDDDRNGFVDDIHGADCRDRDGDPTDTNGHGTHVAGIIGAAANAQGIVGVDRRARLMPLRFLGPDGRGRISDAIRCMDYAIAKGARITNHSWGTDGASTALDDAIARARAAGMIVVASAGNDGRDLDVTGPVHYPSSAPYDNVVAVAATTSYDAVAASSNRGSASVDLAAPGVGILSAIPGGWASRSGTSVAAPHVTGSAALVLAAHPGITYQAVIRRLLDGVDRTTELEAIVASGGRLNVARAVEHDVAAPAAVALHVLSPLRSPVSITVAWISPDEDGRSPGVGQVARYELLVRERRTTLWWRAPAPWPGPPGSLQSARIDGLRPATGYDVVLVAIDNAGNSSRSVPVIASTT